MIHTYMDFDFDIDDFLEGAKDAFYIGKTFSYVAVVLTI